MKTPGTKARQAAAALARANQSSTEWREVIAAQHAAKRGPRFANMLTRREKLFRAQRCALAGGEGFGANELVEMIALWREIEGHELSVRQQRASHSLLRLLRVLNQLISKALGMDFADNAALHPAGCYGSPRVQSRKPVKTTRQHRMRTPAAIMMIAAVLSFAGVAAETNQASPSSPAPPVAGGSGPKIAFATPIYDFGRVKAGELVKYAYVFTNIGGAMLQVSNVQVSCGCTTSGEWTRQVEPGKTGNIPIQFNSANFNGAVGKAITVTCNDTNQPTVMLQIKGTIWKPIDVAPQFAVLNVTSEMPSNAATVRILNNEPEPLTLSAPECNNRAFAVELRTNQPGKEFQLIVKTVPPLPAGNLQGQITLKTSSTNMPVVNVSAWANVQPVLTVMPPQIMLPVAPLANALTPSISIRNIGTNTLALSEPALDAKGVDVQIKEIEAGRSFTVTATFPAGFEIAQGQKVELTLKSNHAQFPFIKVPVVQPSRPAPPAAPPGGAPQ